MAGMTLRAATRSDAAAILAIANPIIRDSLVTFTNCERTLAETEAEIAGADGRFLVCENDGTVCGFASFGPFRNGPGYAHTAEITINLAPVVRRKGLGRALLNRLEQTALDRGMHVLVAGISSANPGAVAFHRAMGYAQVGLMPQVGHKNSKWLDLVLMQKILAQVDHDAPDTTVGAE
ncbi:MAG: N-acetyltransferase family protein [Pseudomonadota bacterium]